MTVFRLYLDTNPLIYALEGDDQQLRNCFRLLFEKLNTYEVFTSELSLAEMLVQPYAADNHDLIERYKKLFRIEGNGFITVVPVSTEVLAHAAGFRGRQISLLKRNPKLPDCIHAATAYLSGCSHFMTRDNGMKLWDQIQIVEPSLVGIESLLRARS